MTGHEPKNQCLPKTAPYPKDPAASAGVIQDFENPRGEETIIPVHWFDERPKIGIRLQFCNKNEVDSKGFIEKLNTYTKWNLNFFIIWQTRKIESIFKLKDKNIHPSHFIYKDTCICGQTVIGEKESNLEVRVNQHSDVNGSGNQPST